MDKRLTYLFFCICGILLLLGCISKEKEKKKEREAADFDVYDKEQFADILYDLTLVEATYRLNLADSGAVVKRDAIYQNILNRHQTDSITFDGNWRYYGGEPEDMQEVYDMVMARIDQERVARGAAPAKPDKPIEE